MANNREPWNEKITRQNPPRNGQHSQDVYRRAENSHNHGSGKKGPKKEKTQLSTVFLTFLVIVMFAIIGGVVVFTFIWNNRNPSQSSISAPFTHSTAAAISVASSSVAAASSAAGSGSSTATTSSSSNTGTYTYQGEQTLAAIEANAGVSWATLAKLNSQLNPNWGQAGDTVGTPLKDGSYLTVGTVLKTQ